MNSTEMAVGGFLWQSHRVDAASRPVSHSQGLPALRELAPVDLVVSENRLPRNRRRRSPPSASKKTAQPV